MYATKEDCLKYIFQLNWMKQPITLARLASLLGLTSAGVSYLIQDLASMDFIILGEGRSEISLTPTGKEKAIDIIRKYGLWKTFLIRNLKYSWNQAIIEAERLEHETSDCLAERMETFLDFPDYCPLGVPIKRELFNDRSDWVALSELDLRQSGKVRFISEQEDLVNYLEFTTLRTDKPVTLMGSVGYGGPYLIENEDREIMLSEKAIELVYVEVI